MSVVPQGKAIQAMYRDYRDGNLLVNRKYQRKLVWAVDEKQALIDSILKGYPLPLILLAERPDVHGSGRYEIIDGIQRLNAIFSLLSTHSRCTVSISTSANSLLHVKTQLKERSPQGLA